MTKIPLCSYEAVEVLSLRIHGNFYLVLQKSRRKDTH